MKIDGIQESAENRNQLERELIKQNPVVKEGTIKAQMNTEVAVPKTPPVSFSFKELSSLQLNGTSAASLELYMKLMMNNAKKANDLIFYVMRAGIKNPTDSTKWQTVRSEISSQLSTILMKQHNFEAYFSENPANQKLFLANQKIMNEISFLLKMLPTLTFETTGKYDFLRMMQIASGNMETGIQMMREFQGHIEHATRLDPIVDARQETNWMIKVLREFGNMFQSRHLLPYELQTENINIWKLGSEYLKLMNQLLPQIGAFPNGNIKIFHQQATKPLTELFQELQRLADGQMTQGGIAVILDRMQGQLTRLAQLFQKMEIEAGFTDTERILGSVDAEFASDMTKMMLLAQQEMSFFDLLVKDFRSVSKQPIFFMIVAIFIILLLIILF
ncbi:hypothetical protein ARI65_001622 [Listeria monocytogenes]|nr:hypothetical protein [Listeria monocytogenes]EAE1670109.1 hypothetical protein [Listeria monocytogenes]EHA1422816.1 hypothetical protein [Listeria monocytogenes]EHA1497471.1 hypothetical protein [Listeria monocytogenes]EHA1573789.1 hypothetical protein [Listeria monocytogenes]